MKRFWLQFFTWWNGLTLGLRFYTWRQGNPVGRDEAGNRYFQSKGGVRRWVIYNGYAEASTIPPGWHAWIHHKSDEPPADYQAREWQQPHLANQTGTAHAYRPPGSIAGDTPGRAYRGEYQAWDPENLPER